MSYEKSAVTDTTAAIPTQPLPQIREDREIDPYRSSRKLLKPLEETPPVGQTNINSGKVDGLEEQKTPEETVTLSPQMAALARKEQKYRQKEQEQKARERSLELERAELSELKALKAKLEAKDYSGIENLVKYDDYTQYLIEKSESATPEQLALKKLTEEVEGVKRAHTEDVSKRFEAAVNERRKAVMALVESNEDFSSIKELKKQEAVVQHILDTWEHDNIDLSPEQAAKEVEEELVSRAGQWAGLSKIKAKLNPAVDEKKQLPPLKAQIKTLTNNMAVTGEVKRTPRSFQHMSDAERYAEARRRAEEKLKLKG